MDTKIKMITILFSLCAIMSFVVLMVHGLNIVVLILFGIMCLIVGGLLHEQLKKIAKVFYLTK